MPPSKKEVEAAYQRNAKIYDFAVKFFYRLIGLRIEEYRSHAVELLRLKKGDCVLELGCGTGLNFPYLMKQIGAEGKLIGVDISSEMLSCAEQRIKRSNWDNVELVHSDLAFYDYHAEINAVLATGVFGYVDERDKILENISKSLAQNSRLVIVDGKRPDRWPLWAFKLFAWASSPFGVTQAYFDNHTWEYVERYFHDSTFEEAYGGLLYISSGVTNE